MTSTDFHCAAARERRLAARRQERTGSDARGHDAGAEQLADDRDPCHVQLQHGVHVAEQRRSRHGRPLQHGSRAAARRRTVRLP